MITDEQVKIAANILDVPLSTTLMRKALEAYEQSKSIREPLSDDEIEKLVPWQGNPKDPFFNRIKFARLVEQAHGIGGDNV